MHERYPSPGATQFAHVTREELDQRLARARAALKNEDLAALLVFAQESHYYLTGYDSTGFVYFQCAVVTADGGPVTLLTRRPDLLQARDTSTIEDIRIWYDGEGVDPALELRELLVERGLKGAQVGIELNTYGLTGFNHERVRRALADVCELVDASGIVRQLRLVKSPSEIAIVRQAAALADRALEAMVEAARPGVYDSALSAACVTAILERGGDMPPAGPLVNSGRRALYGRGVGGSRRLDPRDQVVVEFAATVHRYNVCLERTIVLGEPSPMQRQMFDVVHDALAAMTEAARPGRVLGEIDDAHRRVLDAAGFRKRRYGACGYSLGATYRPSWMDVPPLIYSGNPTPIELGMVLFPHVMLGDADTGLAVGLGHTVLVTANGAEVLCQLPRELLVR